MVPGNVVHVSWPLQPHFHGAPSTITTTRSIVVSRHENLLIVHPDILITPTSRASAPHCMRKPLLASLLRASPASSHNPSLYYGNVLHEVVQVCLAQNQWDADFIDHEIEVHLHKSLDELLRIGVTVEAAKRDIRERASGITSFGQRYMSSSPKVSHRKIDCVP